MTKPVLMLVDDEPSVLESLSVALEDDYQVIQVSGGKAALDRLKKEEVDVVLLDVMMPDLDGVETLRRIRERDVDVDVVMVTVRKDVETVVQCMKLGAKDYIPKPFQIEELLHKIGMTLEARRLRRENLYLRSEMESRTGDRKLIFRSAKMEEVLETVRKVAPQDSTVLISGETGTGKELVAWEIHRQGRRSEGPFCVINCAAIPSELMESELFGHEKGAFTSAHRRALGKFEMASGGTVFLDEVGCLSPAAQAKLLRALQEKKIQRVGGEKTIPVDVRIIAATNMDLEEAIVRSQFREDLYYRLHVVPVHLPSLRERREDIPLLAKYFLAKFSRRMGKSIEGMTREAMESLVHYSWPGNVRELENLLERLIVLTDGRRIPQESLPLEILVESMDGGESSEIVGPLKDALLRLEKQLIRKALYKSRGNRSAAARFLGINRTTLLAKMEQLELTKSEK